MVLLFAFQALAGMIVDVLIGDPRRLPHPARGVGWMIARLEVFLRARFRNLNLAGAVLAATIPLGAAGIVLLILALLASADAWRLPPGITWFSDGWSSIPWFSLIGGGMICGVWFSWRSLGDDAMKIYRLLDAGRLEEARRALSLIVGRDTGHLDEREIVRAVVETEGENSVDGGIAPVFFALLAGPAGVTFFKAVSTLDSMVGYRNARYRDVGMMSARLDDILNYIPARLALLLIPPAAALAGLHPLAAFRVGLRDHARHPSPNSAWGESCFAGALGVQLGGPVSYAGQPSVKLLLGDPFRTLERRDILRARRLLFCVAGLILAGLLTAVGAALQL